MVDGRWSYLSTNLRIPWVQRYWHLMSLVGKFLNLEVPERKSPPPPTRSELMSNPLPQLGSSIHDDPEETENVSVEDPSNFTGEIFVND